MSGGVAANINTTWDAEQALRVGRDFETMIDKVVKEFTKLHTVEKLNEEQTNHLSNAWDKLSTMMSDLGKKIKGVDISSLSSKFDNFRNKINDVGMSLLKMPWTAVKSGISAMSSAISQMAIGALRRLGEMAIEAALQLGRALITKPIEAASALEEMQNKFDVVFKGMEKTAEGWSRTLVESYAMSTRESKFFLSSIQDLLVPMGMSREAAGEMSFATVKLAADLGSFSDIETADVMRDLESALTGQFEPMRKYGIVLNETNVKARALAMGYEVTTGVLDPLIRAQVVHQMVLEGSKDAMGDMARSAESYANQSKVLNSAIEDTWALLGMKLTPVLAEFKGRLAAIIDTNKPLIEHMADRMLPVLKDITNTFLDLAEDAIPWLITGFEGFMDWVDYAVDVFITDWIPAIKEFLVNAVVLAETTLPLVWAGFEQLATVLGNVGRWLTDQALPAIIGFFKGIQESSDEMEKVWRLLWLAVENICSLAVSKIKVLMMQTVDFINKVFIEWKLADVFQVVLEKATAKISAWHEWQVAEAKLVAIALLKAVINPWGAYASFLVDKAALHQGYLEKLSAIDEEYNDKSVAGFAAKIAAQEAEQEGFKANIAGSYEDMKGIVFEKIDETFAGILYKETEFSQTFAEHGAGTGKKYGAATAQGIFHAMPVEESEAFFYTYGSSSGNAFASGYDGGMDKWLTGINEDVVWASQQFDRWAEKQLRDGAVFNAETEAEWERHFEEMKLDVFDFNEYAAKYGTEAALEYEKNFKREWDAVMMPSYNEAFDRFKAAAAEAGGSAGDDFASAFSSAASNFNTSFSNTQSTWGGQQFQTYEWNGTPWMTQDNEWYKGGYTGPGGGFEWMHGTPTQEMLDYWGIAHLGGMIDALTKQVIPSMHNGGLARDEMLVKMLHNEYVLNPRATESIGKEKLDYMNNTGQIPGAGTHVHFHGFLITPDSVQEAANIMGPAIERQKVRGY